MDEEWVNIAGHGARQRAEELRAQQSTVRRWTAALLGLHTEERAWRKGAEGEEAVGRRLARLPEGWQVLHDLTIGTQGANLDHLVVGPPGIFTVNTKHHTGRVTVYERAILHNGRKTAYVPKALGEAQRVQAGISRVLGREVTTRSVLVMVGCDLDVRKRPADVTVISARRIPRWFTKQKPGRLSRSEVTEAAAAACLPQTWLSTNRARISPPKSGSEASRSAASDDQGVDTTDWTTHRWRRFGHDRLYLNDATGATLGHLDLKTGEEHVEDLAHADAIKRALRAARPSD